jgi:hypothetical protein
LTIRERIAKKLHVSLADLADKVIKYNWDGILFDLEDGGYRYRYVVNSISNPSFVIETDDDWDCFMERIQSQAEVAIEVTQPKIAAAPIPGPSWRSSTLTSPAKDSLEDQQPEMLDVLEAKTRDAICSLAGVQRIFNKTDLDNFPFHDISTAVQMWNEDLIQNLQADSKEEQEERAQYLWDIALDHI